tara:strand:+ start:581 stop:739 length:159 start_codon:yes stop_codon:yes gene_type:complete
LFDIIEEAEKDKLHMQEGEFDPNKGYLSSVYIDRYIMMTKEKMGYYLCDLKY